MKLYGGIEAGGTKFICAIGDESGAILEKTRIETLTPNETMPKVIEFFKNYHEKNSLSGIGIASFGPVDPDPNSPTYGYITSTPKLPWTNYNILGAVKNAMQLPVGFDTDVNAAAIGEHQWGAAQGLDTFIYVTIGTGIGGGGMIEGKVLHGLMHPEMGHILIPQDKAKDPFEGVCPFHKNCFEGLASGPSLMQRWNVDNAMKIPPDHEAWNIEADYIAKAFANYTMMLSPQKIIAGGGVMKKEGLLDLVRPKVIEYLNGYIKQDAILKDIQNYICLPGLGEQSGICGAIALAIK